MLLSALLLGIVYFVVLPPWMGEDEPWHFEYVHAVSRGHLPLGGGEEARAVDLPDYPPGILFGSHHLPSLSRAEALRTQTEIAASMRAERFDERVDSALRHGDPRTLDEMLGDEPFYTSFNQPRGYYLLAGAIVRLSGASGPAAELQVARLLSLAGYLAVVALTLGLARLVTQDEHAVLVAGLVAAWLPLHVGGAAVVNNDVLAKVAGAAVLYLSARHASGRGGLRDLVLAGLCLAVGLFTKTTAAGGLVAVALALFLRKGTSARVRSAGLAAILLLAAAAIAYWLHTHNAALPKSVERFQGMLDEGLRPKSLLKLWATTVGTTNWETRLLPNWAYDAVGGVGMVALAGALWGLVRHEVWFARRLHFLCVSLVLVQVALLVLRSKAVGRYWLPVLPAVGVIFAIGILGLVPERWRRRAALAAVLFFVVYEGAFLWGALVVQQYLVWGA